MKKQTYCVTGMSCAACASRVEKAALSVEGVSEASVALLKNSLTVLMDESKVKDGAIEAAVSRAGYGASLALSAGVQRADTKEADSRRIRLYLSLALTLILMLISMGGDFGFKLVPDALMNAAAQAILALMVMILQRRYFISAGKALSHFEFNMDSLVSLGALCSFGYSLWVLFSLVPGMDSMVLKTDHAVYFESSAAILTFVAIGKYLEERAKVKTTDAMMGLYDLAPKFARLKTDDGEQDVPLEKIGVGDIIVLKAGDSVGVDGCVSKGEGHVDESSLTGESRAVKKIRGDEVISASRVLDGYLEIAVTATGSDTTLSKIIQLVDDATSQKAPAARLADLVAGRFVPCVILVAAAVFLLWYFILGAEAAAAVNYAVSVLVVSCPCALGLATPVAIMAGTGRAARAGILFKSPEAIENLQKATAFAFDKTGTLTEGSMSVLKIVTRADMPENLCLMFAACLEKMSPHPVARAIMQKMGDKISLPKVQNFYALDGQGITGEISGTPYGVGNLRLGETMCAPLNAEDKELIATFEQAGRTCVGFYTQYKLLALFVIGDALKPQAKAALAGLKSRGLLSVMLTGDSENTAQAVAAELGINEVRAGLLPAAKGEEIAGLREQGHNVVMVGDGVNDSVSLTAADTGISLAGSSDIALSACQVVLMRHDLEDTVNAYDLSKKTMAVIKQNLFWAFFYNIIFIPVAAGALEPLLGLRLTPTFAALLMSCSSVCVVLNALRLSFVKIKRSSVKEEHLMQKEIKVGGMHCEHCVATVSKALSGLPGVSDVKVSLKENRAVFSAADSVSDELVKAAVESAGFDAGEIKSL